MKPDIIARWFLAAYFAFLAIRSVLAVRFATDLIGASNMAGSIVGALLSFFLGYMTYSRPREWGFGVGVFLVLCIPIQIFLWILGGEHLRRTNPDYHPPVVRFICEEGINIIAASICFALRRITRGMPNQHLSTTDQVKSGDGEASGQR